MTNCPRCNGSAIVKGWANQYMATYRCLSCGLEWVVEKHPAKIKCKVCGKVYQAPKWYLKHVDKGHHRTPRVEARF